MVMRVDEQRKTPLSRTVAKGSRGRLSFGKWLLVLASALLLLACKGKAQPAAAEKADAGAFEPYSLTPEMAAKVLAKVGDDTITLGDFALALEHMDQFDRLRYQAPKRRRELLDEMINIRLLALEAKREGLDKDPLVQMELREVQREAMLEEARKGSPTPGEIPEAQVRAYFDAHADEYKDPERRRVSLVVLKDEGTAKVVLEAAQKAVAPAAWGELVRGKSIDSQAHANVPLDLAGDFGFVAPPGDSRSESPRVPEAVRVAVFEIPRVGAVLPRVVKGADGLFYVVRLSQISEARTRSFVEAERSIRVKLAQDALRERERKMLDELRTQYKIEVVEDGLSKVAVPSADGGEALPHAHDGPDASSGSPH